MLCGAVLAACMLIPVLAPRLLMYVLTWGVNSYVVQAVVKSLLELFLANIFSLFL